MCSLNISAHWRYLKFPSLPEGPPAAQLCWTWSWGRTEGGLCPTKCQGKRSACTSCKKHSHPRAVCLSHGREKQGSTHPSTCSLNRSPFLLPMTLPRGQQSGSPSCSALSLSKEGTVGDRGSLFPLPTVGDRGSLFSLPTTHSCPCITQNKSIQLFTNRCMRNASVYMSVPVCGLLLMLCSYPVLGALWCTPRNAFILLLPESVA